MFPSPSWVQLGHISGPAGLVAANSEGERVLTRGRSDEAVESSEVEGDGASSVGNGEEKGR